MYNFYKQKNISQLHWLTDLSDTTSMRLHVFQHRQSLKGGVSSPGHPRHRRRGDRFLPRLGHLRAMSTCRGASVGGGRRAQRHRAVRPVPRETQTVHHVWAGYLLKTRRGCGRPRRTHSHVSCRVPLNPGLRTPPVLALAEEKSWSLDLYERGVFTSRGETCFNDFKPLSILLYLMKKHWRFAPRPVRCVLI